MFLGPGEANPADKRSVTIVSIPRIMTMVYYKHSTNPTCKLNMSLTKHCR